MDRILTIILFFIYTWGLGFSATFFIKKNYDGLEKNLMNVGIGMGVFSILSIILNTLRIPLDWKIFLILSVIIPSYSLYQKYKTDQLKELFKWPKFKLKKSNLIISIVILIFILTLTMYIKGAFKYPYLEDNDPWGHSVGVKYVAIEKNAFDPYLPGEERDAVLSYIDPYPPAYDIMQGILHQTAKDLNWSLKFFNALISSLGIIFFFFMAKLFLVSNKKALFATIIFASLPSYLSHFIWAHSLVITLFFPTMYCLEKARSDRRWVIPTIIMIAAVWVSQNISQPLKITTMILIYLVVISVACRKTFWRGFVALIGGLMLSQFWWGVMFSRYGVRNFIGLYSASVRSETVSSIVESSSEITTKVVSSNLFTKIIGLYKSMTNPGGTGTRAYLFNDFFIAKSQNAINNPIGLGKVVTILVIIGLLFLLIKYKQEIVKKQNALILVSIFWLIFTFWGVNGQTFFYGLLKENGKSLAFSVARGPFRVWMLMAIPVSLIAAEGGFFIMNIFRKNKLTKIIIMLLIIIGIIFTSAVYKYDVNTAIWPTTGAFSGPQEATDYGVWFQKIPPNTKVFIYSPRDKLVIGFGGFSCEWCQEIIDFRKEIIHRNIEELYLFLKENKYEYFIINPRMDHKYLEKIDGYSQELLNNRYQEIVNSGYFDLEYQKEGVFAILKVK